LRVTRRGELLRCESLVDFVQGELDLLLADRVRGRFLLPLQVGPVQPQGFELSNALDVDWWRPADAAPPLCFPLFDLFLDSRFRVYEAFSGVTHMLIAE
jgi:hypothetical protein